MHSQQRNTKVKVNDARLMLGITIYKSRLFFKTSLSTVQKKSINHPICYNVVFDLMQQDRLNCDMLKYRI